MRKTSQRPNDTTTKHQPHVMNSRHQPNGGPPGHQPNGGPPGHQPNGGPPSHQPNGVPPSHQPNGVSPGHQPNGVSPGHQPNDIDPRHRPNSIFPGHRPNGVSPQRRQSGITSNTRYTPYGINTRRQQNSAISTTRHTPNVINPERQQNGVSSNARDTPNGTSPQHEREGRTFERRQCQIPSQGQAVVSPQPAPIEDDYPVPAIRVPVSADERPHYVNLKIRDCGCRPGCRCQYPDLRRFLGEHETWDIDYQMFRAVWEPPGLESLHGTYVLFTIKTLTPSDILHPTWNRNFLAAFKGDVFVLKVKESIDERAALTTPPGCPVRTLPHESGVTDAQYETIDVFFFGSDLFTDMALAATHPYSRVCTPGLTNVAATLGFWRAFVQGRARAPDEIPVPPGLVQIMARYWPAT